MTAPIAILLTTYNSEKFLKPQLDSLFYQTFQDFILYVHDDGSKDKTLDIISEYQKRHDNICMLKDEQCGRKALGSFIWLLEQVKSPYYMFCDHDDVWLPEKIEKTYALMLEKEKMYPDKPVVVHTDLCVVDASLKTIHPSFWQYNKIDRRLMDNHFNYLAVCNAFTGCTMMINQCAKQVSLPVGRHAMVHDQWIGLKVVASGGISAYLEEATILYRQHAQNEVGAQRVDRKYYRNRLLAFKEVWQDNKKTLAMIRSIRKYSFAKYVYYKVSYYWKRFR